MTSIDKCRRHLVEESKKWPFPFSRMFLPPFRVGSNQDALDVPSLPFEMRLLPKNAQKQCFFGDKSPTIWKCVQDKNIKDFKIQKYPPKKCWKKRANKLAIQESKWRICSNSKGARPLPKDEMFVLYSSNHPCLVVWPLKVVDPKVAVKPQAALGDEKKKSCYHIRREPGASQVDQAVVQGLIEMKELPI